MSALQDKALDLQARLVARPDFRAWAADFPLTRWVARRRTRDLFDLCAGFVYSQILATCMRLGLFDLVAEGPLSNAEARRRLPIRADAVDRLLLAATSLKLLSKRSDGCYGLGTLGAALADNPAIVAMVDHHRFLYDDLRDPISLLAETPAPSRLGAFWAYARHVAPAEISGENVKSYCAFMSATQHLLATEIVASYDFGRHRCLLDLGGGEGVFLQQVGKACPDLDLGLFELPAVAERAKRRLGVTEFRDRIKVFSGNAFVDRLPGGADVISLVRIIHDHSDDAVLTLLRAIARILPKSGTLVVAEPLADAPGAERTGAYFAFYLLAMGQGRPRTAGELSALLARAGFETVTCSSRNPVLTSIIVARQSSSN